MARKLVCAAVILVAECRFSIGIESARRVGLFFQYAGSRGVHHVFKSQRILRKLVRVATSQGERAPSHVHPMRALQAILRFLPYVPRCILKRVRNLIGAVFGNLLIRANWCRRFRIWIVTFE